MGDSDEDRSEHAECPCSVSLRLVAVREYFFSSSCPQAGANQVSTTFHPRAFLGQRTVPDVAFISSDGVRFHAHNAVLDAISVNGFDGLLAGTADNVVIPNIRHRYVHVMDDAATFNVVLLAAYELDPQPYAPDLPTLLRAADAGLRRYGLLPSHTITPGAPLADVLLAHAQRGPNIALDIYTLAARHQVGPLAVSVSNYMHGLDLSTLSDERAHQLGECSIAFSRFLWGRQPYTPIEVARVADSTRQRSPRHGLNGLRSGA